LEWLHDHNLGEAGVIFSASKRVKEGGRKGVHQQKEGNLDPKRRKAGGVLRHPVHNLKKVARLSSEDRDEVLKVLKKNGLRRQGGVGVNRSCSANRQVSHEVSSSSVSLNNDWENWVALQGNDQLVIDDVCGIGNSIGVKVKGDTANMFNVLSRAGMGKKEKSRQEQGGARKEKGC
jgi:hypothetical protein